MKVELLQQQNLFHFHEQEIVNYAIWIMKKVTALEPAYAWEELSLVFTDDSIRSLNFQWFGKESVTDVISFAYSAPPCTGEVIVNVQQAHEEGKLRESPDRELALYIAHGCHHLMGAEDNTPERKTLMLRMEEAWVNEAVMDLKIGPFFK